MSFPLADRTADRLLAIRAERVGCVKPIRIEIAAHFGLADRSLGARPAARLDPDRYIDKERTRARPAGAQYGSADAWGGPIDLTQAYRPWRDGSRVRCQNRPFCGQIEFTHPHARRGRPTSNRRPAPAAAERCDPRCSLECRSGKVSNGPRPRSGYRRTGRRRCHCASGEHKSERRPAECLAGHSR
jgi:hypothetical protein